VEELGETAYEILASVCPTALASEFQFVKNSWLLLHTFHTCLEAYKQEFKPPATVRSSTTVSDEDLESQLLVQYLLFHLEEIRSQTFVPYRVLYRRASVPPVAKVLYETPDFVVCDVTLDCHPAAVAHIVELTVESFLARVRAASAADDST